MNHKQVRKINKIASAWSLVSTEFLRFLKNAFGSVISLEFIKVAVPLLIVWELLPRFGIVPKTLLPTPWQVAAAFWEMLVDHSLIEHMKKSMFRFFMGFGLATITAVPIGTLMGANLYIRKHLLPLFQVLAPVPPPAWVPLTIVLFGIGLPMQTFLIFLGAFYPILFNTYQGVKDTDTRYLASARLFGASELTLILKVYFWHAVGSLVMGIKIGVAMGLVMLVIAEMYGGQTGIGYLLVETKEYFQLDRMVVCMIILGFWGWFLIEVMKYVELKLAIWRMPR